MTIGFPCSVCKFDANIIQNAVVDIETVMKWCTTSVDPVKCASTFNFRKKKYPRIFSRHRKKTECALKSQEIRNARSRN